MPGRRSGRGEQEKRKGNNFCQAHIKFATVLSKHRSLPAPHFRKDPAPQTCMRSPGCIHVLGFHPAPAHGPPFYPVCTQTREGPRPKGRAEPMKAVWSFPARTEAGVCWRAHRVPAPRAPTSHISLQVTSTNFQGPLPARNSMVQNLMASGSSVCPRKWSLGASLPPKGSQSSLCWERGPRHDVSNPEGALCKPARLVLTGGFQALGAAGV